MKYVSTRGGAPETDFKTALLGGLAPDGGLYLPEHWPAAHELPIHARDNAAYPRVVARTLVPYADDWISAAEIEGAAKRSYSNFRRPDVAPTVRIGDGLWLLELFHGPTLAFKDLAMQLLATLIEKALVEENREATIICATSGDTGGAAVEAFRGKTGIRVVVLFPEGRISDVQRRMMTTAREDNVRAIAVAGDFDACQRIVKSLLGDPALARRLGLSAVNSINWARLAIQIAYYFAACAEVAAQTRAEMIDFVVPTGNFGDAFAGVAAKRMGAPIGKIVAAVNRNDVVHRALTTGRYSPGSVAPTISPSMDIEVASNFERMLFEASGRNADKVSTMMDALSARGAFDIDAETLAALREDLHSETASEEETRDVMRRCYEARGMVADPHTAVGFVAVEKARARGVLRGEVVSLATAHAAKFPDAVEAAISVRPKLPDGVEDFASRRERFLRAPASVDRARELLFEFTGS